MILFLISLTPFFIGGGEWAIIVSTFLLLFVFLKEMQFK